MLIDGGNSEERTYVTAVHSALPPTFSTAQLDLGVHVGRLLHKRRLMMGIWEDWRKVCTVFASCTEWQSVLFQDGFSANSEQGICGTLLPRFSFDLCF